MYIVKKYSPFLLLIFILFLVELFIDPIGEFSLNDDWAYAKAVYHWNETGMFSIGIWPAMSLWSHALLGLAFVKIFGFSYTVLRLANMFLCVITLFHIYTFFCKTNKKSISVLVCAFIVFNPYYLNLFNSFMTDLSFFNYSFLSFFYLNEFLTGRKRYNLVLFFLLGILAMLTRQLGIILFVGYIFIEVINYSKLTKRSLLISIFLFGFALLVLYVFEGWQLVTSKPEASYQGLFLSHKKVEIVAESLVRMVNKTFMIILYSGSLLLLLFALDLNELIARIKKANKIIGIIVLAVFTFYLSKLINDHVVGNLVINLGLGIESTVDLLFIKGDDKHSSNGLLFNLLLFLFCCGYFLFALLIGTVRWKKVTLLRFTLSQQFVGSLLMFYLLLIGMAESSFDRYCIYFMLFFAALFMSRTIRYSQVSLIFSSLFFFVMASYSILATKDYFSAAHLKNKMRNDLILKDKIEPEQMNAGFEYQLWDKTENEINWISWDHYNEKKYIISRGPIQNFDIYKTYTYKRFIPFKTDTFFVLRKGE